MNLVSYSSFFVLVLFMVYTPGPMTSYMLANGMKVHHKNLWPILIGANNAYLLSIILFTIGLTEIFQTHILLFKSVQIGGIAYLLFLAFSQWNKETIKSSTLTDPKNTYVYALYSKGAFIALSNPKTIILFGVIFPQFIEDSQHYYLQILILGITFLVLQFSSGLTYAYCGRRIQHLIENPRTQHLINKISAGVLILVALFLITKLQ